jgi:uncharacterized protein YjbJ (UPF0337 family)
MGEDRAEETSRRVRNSVRDAIGKITGNAGIRSEDAAAKSLGEEDTAGVTDQPNHVSEWCR